MTLSAESAEYALQPVPLKFGLAQQLIPIVRRVAALEHFAKDAVGTSTLTVSIAITVPCGRPLIAE